MSDDVDVYVDSDWGVVLDDAGSMDVYPTRDEAEIVRRNSGVEFLPLVRIDYVLVKGWGEE